MYLLHFPSSKTFLKYPSAPFRPVHPWKTGAKQGDGSDVSVILYFADDANVCEFSLFVVKRETCSTLASSHAAGHSLRSGQAAVSNADDEVSNSHTFASPADKVYREHRNRTLVHKNRDGGAVPFGYSSSSSDRYMSWIMSSCAIIVVASRP